MTAMGIGPCCGRCVLLCAAIRKEPNFFTACRIHHAFILQLHLLPVPRPWADLLLVTSAEAETQVWPRVWPLGGVCGLMSQHNGRISRKRDAQCVVRSYKPAAPMFQGQAQFQGVMVSKRVTNPEKWYTNLGCGPWFSFCFPFSFAFTLKQTQNGYLDLQHFP